MHMNDLCSHMDAHVCMRMQFFAYVGTCMPLPMVMHDSDTYCHLQAPTPLGGGSYACVCKCLHMQGHACRDLWTRMTTACTVTSKRPTPQGGSTLKI